MLPRRAWALIRDTVEGFVEDEAMTRGAAVACYTMFSLAPLLAVAIAGLAFGEEAVRGAVGEQLRALVGREGADAVQAMMRGVGEEGVQGGSGIPAAVSVAVLLLTASGVFAELQSALNAVWKAVPKAITVSYLLRARLLSIGLVAATGFLLLVSLLASAALAALASWAGGLFPEMAPPLAVLGFLVSFALTAALFAAIYKVLPDRRLEWRDVAVGAIGTAVLFNLGKALIGWYIGGSGLARSYGAAGALVVVLLWVYYSAQIFLLGAEFTRAWAGLEGSKRDAPVGPQDR
jgi:membrane protein